MQLLGLRCAFPWETPCIAHTVGKATPTKSDDEGLSSGDHTETATGRMRFANRGRRSYERDERGRLTTITVPASSDEVATIVPRWARTSSWTM